MSNAILGRWVNALSDGTQMCGDSGGVGGGWHCTHSPSHPSPNPIPSFLIWHLGSRGGGTPHPPHPMSILPNIRLARGGVTALVLAASGCQQAIAETTAAGNTCKVFSTCRVFSKCSVFRKCSV